MKEKTKLNKPIVAVAMSGGVDSSVAAALLKKQGFKVFGITMKTFCYAKTPGGPKTCCGFEGIESAKAVCKKLGISHYTADVSKEFTKKVVDYFISEYRAGRTPNPCVKCNQFIKFGILLKSAKKYGADFLATGHYARLRREILNSKHEIRNPLGSRWDPTGSQRDKPPHSPPISPEAKQGEFPPEADQSLAEEGVKISFHLLRGVDKNKDQSYFLYNLSQKQLSQVVFPLGNFKKEEVRNLARRFKLSVAEKPESQEICFINTNLSEFLSSRINANPGDIVDASGKNLGKHRGVIFYTVGQRAGVGGKGPYYIAKIDNKNNRLIVTNKTKDSIIFRREIVVSKVNWISCERGKKSEIRNPSARGGSAFGGKSETNSKFSPFGTSPEGRQIPNSKNKYFEIQIRYRAKAVLGKIFNLGKNRVKIVLNKPVFAPAPGQSAVFYKGNECLGGGIIE